MCARTVRLVLLPVAAAMLWASAAFASEMLPLNVLVSDGKMPQSVVAMDDGTVYVLSVDADGTTTVKVHTASSAEAGRRAASLTAGTANDQDDVPVELSAELTQGLSRAYGMTMDGNGSIYVADTNNRRVVRIFNSDGGAKAVALISGLDYPKDVAVDREKGFLYVAESGTQTIRKFNFNGEELDYPLSGKGVKTDLNQPHGICTDIGGNLYVASIYPPNGNFEGYGIIRKYARNQADTNPVLRIGKYGTKTDEILTPEDVAVDSGGNIWVADTGNHRIKKYSPKGEFIGNYGGFGKEAGNFYTPVKLDIVDDGSGDVLYVTDSDQGRIQAFDIGRMLRDDTGPVVSMKDIDPVYPGEKIMISGSVSDPDSGVAWAALDYVIVEVYLVGGVVQQKIHLMPDIYLTEGADSNYYGYLDTSEITVDGAEFPLKHGYRIRYRLKAMNNAGKVSYSDAIRRIAKVVKNEENAEPWTNRMWYPVGISSDMMTNVVGLFWGAGVARVQFWSDSKEKKDYYSHFSMYGGAPGSVDAGGKCEIDQPRPGISYWVYDSRDKLENFKDVAEYYPHAETDQGNVYKVKLETGWNMIANPYAPGVDPATYKPIIWRELADSATPGNVDLRKSGPLEDYVDGPYEFKYDESLISVNAYNTYFDNNDVGKTTFFKITAYSEDLQFTTGGKWMKFPESFPSYVVVQEKVLKIRNANGVEKDLLKAKNNGWISNNVMKLEGNYSKLNKGDELEPWKGYFLYVPVSTAVNDLWLWFHPDGENGTPVFADRNVPAENLKEISFNRTGCKEPKDNATEKVIAGRVMLKGADGGSIIKVGNARPGEDEIIDVQLSVDAEGFYGGSFVIKYDDAVVRPYDKARKREITEIDSVTIPLNTTIKAYPADIESRSTEFHVVRSVLGNSVHVAVMNMEKSFDRETIVGTLSFKVLADTPKSGTEIYVDTGDTSFTLIGEGGETAFTDYAVTQESVYVVAPGAQGEILLISQSAEYISQVPGHDTVDAVFKPVRSARYRADVVSASAPAQSIVTLLADTYLSSSLGFTTVTWNGLTAAGAPAAEGEYKIRITRLADDYVDTAELLAPVVMDTTAPVVVSVFPNTLSHDPNFITRVSVYDELSGVDIDTTYISIDSNPIENCRVLSKTAEGIEPFVCRSNEGVDKGEHSVSATVSDKAGNTSEHIWNVDLNYISIEELDFEWDGNHLTIHLPDRMKQLLAEDVDYGVEDILRSAYEIVINDQKQYLNSMKESNPYFDINYTFMLNGEAYVYPRNKAFNRTTSRQIAPSDCPFTFEIYVDSDPGTASTDLNSIDFLCENNSNVCFTTNQAIFIEQVLNNRCDDVNSITGGPLGLFDQTQVLITRGNNADNSAGFRDISLNDRDNFDPLSASTSVQATRERTILHELTHIFNSPVLNKTRFNEGLADYVKYAARGEIKDTIDNKIIMDFDYLRLPAMSAGIGTEQVFNHKYRYHFDRFFYKLQMFDSNCVNNFYSTVRNLYSNGTEFIYPKTFYQMFKVNYPNSTIDGMNYGEWIGRQHYLADYHGQAVRGSLPLPLREVIIPMIPMPESGGADDLVGISFSKVIIGSALPKPGIVDFEVFNWRNDIEPVVKDQIALSERFSGAASKTFRESAAGVNNGDMGRLKIVVRDVENKNSYGLLFIPARRSDDSAVDEHIGLIGVVTNRDAGILTINLAGQSFNATLTNGTFYFSDNNDFIKNHSGEITIEYRRGGLTENPTITRSFTKLPGEKYLLLTDTSISPYDSINSPLISVYPERQNNIVILRWDKISMNVIPHFMGYKVYRNEHQFSDNDWGEVLSLIPNEREQNFLIDTDSNKTYYYRVTIVDKLGNEFPISNGVKSPDYNGTEVAIDYLPGGIYLKGFNKDPGTISNMEQYLKGVVGDMADEFVSVYNEYGEKVEDLQSAQVVQGKGYWISVHGINKLPVRVFDGPELSENDVFNVSLNSGWNIVSNPFPNSIIFDSEHFIFKCGGTDYPLRSAMENNIISGGAFCQGGNRSSLPFAFGNQNLVQLGPGDGCHIFLINNTQSCSLETRWNNPGPAQTEFSFLKYRLSFTPMTIDGYSLEDQDALGYNLIVGNTSSNEPALDGYDSFDAPGITLPSGEKSIAIYSVHESWEPGFQTAPDTLFSADWRTNLDPSELVHSFLINVSTNGINEGSIIEFEIFDQRRGGYSIAVDYFITELQPGQDGDYHETQLFVADSDFCKTSGTISMICNFTANSRGHSRYLLSIRNKNTMQQNPEELTVAGRVALEDLENDALNSGTQLVFSGAGSNEWTAETDEDGYFYLKMPWPSQPLGLEVRHDYYIHETFDIPLPSSTSFFLDITPALLANISHPNGTPVLIKGNPEDDAAGYTLANGTFIDNEDRRFSERTVTEPEQLVSIMLGGPGGFSTRQYPYDTDRMNWHEAQHSYSSEIPVWSESREKSDLNGDAKITSADESIFMQYLNRQCNDVNCHERCVMEPSAATGCSTDNPDCAQGSSCKRKKHGQVMPWSHLDADGNGTVAYLNEYAHIFNCISSTQEQCVTADIDESGLVTQADLAAFQNLVAGVNDSWVLNCTEDKCGELCLVESGDVCSINSTDPGCHCRVDGFGTKMPWTAADVDGDGAITTGDYIRILQEVKKDEWTTGPSSSHEAADVNGDGEVTLADMAAVKPFFAKQWNSPVIVREGVQYFSWNLCIPKSGIIEDACEPTPGTSADPTYQGSSPADQLNWQVADREMRLSETPDISGKSCLERCLWGYQNGADQTTWSARQNIRMFHHADVDGNGSINLQDLAIIKDYLNRGSGPRFNPGFQRVDYNGDGYVSPGEEAQGAKKSGKDRCYQIQQDFPTICYVCNDLGLQADCSVSTNP